MGRVPRAPLDRAPAPRHQPAPVEHDPAPSRARSVPRPRVFDGELIAFSDGQRDVVAFARDASPQQPPNPIAYVAFDVLSLEGTNAMREPYWNRREILESLNRAGPHWIVTPSFIDGAALWKVVEEQELEGLVAKPLGSLYKPGERGWLTGREPRVLDVQR
jgi:bifunctional non-homologous end joining protein LigD